MPDFLHIEEFIKASGQLIALIGLFGIIFAETGLLIGFFLPGDSLLFTAGILASQGYLDIVLLCLVLFIAAVAGDSTGYAIGNKVGRRFFNRKDSLLFHKDHLLRAQAFYEKHGGKTIILARFMPIIRTFAPVVAGIGDMPYPRFLAYNIVGGALWAIGIPTLGFTLGKLIPDIDKILLPIIGLIVLLSIAPAFYEMLKTEKQRQKMYTFIKRIVKKQS